MSINTKGDERNNQAVGGSGAGYEGSECLSILKEIRELHEDNIRRIDDEVGEDGAEIKLKAMQSWISDLEEQHAVFLQTMVQLEHEVVDRVSLLQEGLHRSSQAALAYRTKLDDAEKPVMNAQNEELQYMQIRKLQSDITSLLELIRRVREENSWDVSGLTFNEVTFEDVFGTENMISGRMEETIHDTEMSTVVSISMETSRAAHQNQDKDAVIADLNDGILRLRLPLESFEDDKRREVSKMKEEIVSLKFDIKQKDEQIQRIVRRIQAFHNKIHNRFNKCGNAVDELPPDELLTWSLEALDQHFQRALEEKEELTTEVTHLKTKLMESKAETERLIKTVSDMKKDNKDMCECLTVEVAEKHDKILALHRQIVRLEEKCYETEMKVLLKENAIKEMRKDLKTLGFNHVSCSPGYTSTVNNSQQEEQSLCNVSQHVDNNRNNNQQVQAPVNKSDHQLGQVYTSHDDRQHSFPYQYRSTPIKSSTPCSEKNLNDVGNTDESKNQSAYDSSLCLHDTDLSHISDVTDQLTVEESYYEVCRRNSPPTRDLQPSAVGKIMFGPKSDTVLVENLASQEKNNMDSAEHLKNLLIISDNTIKTQEENINGLQDTLKKYESDLNDLQIKAVKMEVELKDSELKYIQQITDRDVMINDLQKILRTSQTEVEMLKEKCEKYERSAEAVQEERENLKTEMEKLQNNLMSREKVAANQEEIINILQDSVNIAQKEQQDLQQKLKDAEAGKEKLLNTLQEERKKAENLQEALMVTKQQLEDLQGNKYEVIIKERIIRRLHLYVCEIKNQYSNCYAEVLKQEKVLNTLRDSIDHLRTEIVNLEQDIRLMELHLAEKLKVLHSSKTRESEKWIAESQKGNESFKDTVESLNGKVSFLNDLLKEKSKVLARIQADNEMLQKAAEQYNSLMAEAHQEKANLKLEIKDLQGQLEKSEFNHQYAVKDSKKYQGLILEAANQEVRLQKEFTEQERQVLQKLSSQTEELQICDAVDTLNTALLNIKMELAQRDAQLQSVACQNHLSTQTIERLQKDLEMKDETIDSLQGNMNEISLNLLTTVNMLKGNEQLIQNLQSQNSELQRQLQSENLRSAASEEVHTTETEALPLKSQVKRCTLFQDGMNVEVKECLSIPETWWWDDFWQM